MIIIHIDAVTKQVAAKSERRKRAKRIPGICASAQLLGVSRQHLYAVLTQKRKGSKSLLSRLKALRQLQRANTANPQNHTIKTDTEQTPLIP